MDYGDLLSAVTFSLNPKKIIEFGLLDGFSLDKFIHNSSHSIIKSFDIFEEFEGNRPNKELIKKFYNYDNVEIKYGNFYDKYLELKDNSIDILHIDIANDGDVYQFGVEKYYSKLTENGIIILEGGSDERDNVKWMKDYNKRPIKDYLKNIKNYKTIGNFPSMTIIKKILK